MGVKKYAPSDLLEIQHHGDLPARSGVGSSSAFAVGLIHSLKILKGLNPTPTELANDAINLEQEDLGENVGSQDQIACSVGGINSISFYRDRDWKVSPLFLSDNLKSEIEERMVLVFSGVSRSSSDISKGLLENLKSKSKHLQRTIELARECRMLLENGSDLDILGEMLNESWKIKSLMNPEAVNPKLEELNDRAKWAGALGGKILGAGGGGFCLFWLKSGSREAFLEKLGPIVHVPIRISMTGSTCILNSTIQEA
jgi:D-glycero-alpha-D-manno-heptose-7-phosphate kinase